MHPPKLNMAVILSSPEWREQYQAAIRRLLPDASGETIDPDNDLVMQGRMMGHTPEQCAEFIAGYVRAHQ